MTTLTQMKEGVDGVLNQSREAMSESEKLHAVLRQDQQKIIEEVGTSRERFHTEFGIKAVTGFPSGLCPQVPINDKRWYPIYAKCVELDLPFLCCVGVPGPRLPLAPRS